MFFDTEVDAKQRLIVWLNGLEYHVYNRLEQNMLTTLYLMVHVHVSDL